VEDLLASQEGFRSTLLYSCLIK